MLFLRRPLLDALILGYLTVTALGLFATFTHIVPPFLAGPVVFSYGMMAPYQRDPDTNTEPVLLASEASGATRTIPFLPYFPGLLHGERNSRSRLDALGNDEAVLREAYAPILLQILEHERRRGHPYVTLSLYRETWLRSSGGYETRRFPPVRRFLLSVP